MPTHSPQTKSDAIERCYEEIERMEAHMLADEAPETWIVGTFDAASIDAAIADSHYSVSPEVVRELLTPLDGETRGKLVDRALEAYHKDHADRDKASTAASSAPSSQSWSRWLPLPMIAVAASLLTLFYVDARTSDEPELPRIEASASTAMLAGGNGDGPLRVMQDRHFDLTCSAGDDTTELRGVHARAESGDSDESDGSVTLGSRQVERSSPGVHLDVRADLPPGPWRIYCEGQIRGRRAQGPPTMIIVE